MNKNIILMWGLFTVLLSILMLLIYFNSNLYILNNRVVVEYIGNYNHSITPKEKIIDLAKDFFNHRDSLNEDINTHLLEDLITQDQYIKKAEVYLDVSGLINIYVYLREPYVRLLRDNKIYHFDSEKVLLPLLSNIDKNLLVITGDLDDDAFDKVLDLSKEIYNNNFLNKMIGGIHYDTDIGYTLSSKICDLAIRIGKTPLIDKLKSDKIKLFYSFLSQELNCDYCKSINIEYDKQIICIN